jgi:hypothetical protein
MIKNTLKQLLSRSEQNRGGAAGAAPPTTPEMNPSQPAVVDRSVVDEEPGEQVNM